MGASGTAAALLLRDRKGQGAWDGDSPEGFPCCMAVLNLFTVDYVFPGL